MATIDIRKVQEGDVNKIIFADGDGGDLHATLISKGLFSQNGRIRIHGQVPTNFTYVIGKKEALNLIKALEKAVALGWVS